MAAGRRHGRVSGDIGSRDTPFPYTLENMRLTSYILAADPSWLEVSVRSYYSVVEEIVVCYDRDKLGLTGVPIPVDECIDRVRAVDVDRKVRLLPGSFYRPGSTPMENETNQRQHALAAASERADWVVQMDTDEVMPDARYFVERLRGIPAGYGACFWPMRVMFKQIDATRFLEVATRFRRPFTEYPGPIACRPSAHLTLARRTDARLWILRVRAALWDRISRRQPDANEYIESGKAILHFSWARSEDEIRRKLRSFSHSHDFDTEAYLRNVWLDADTRWRSYRNFHPIWPKVWPALRLVELPRGFGVPAPTP
jgi:hypothetical protein